MGNITAKLVKDLRDKTGAGMMIHCDFLLLPLKKTTTTTTTATTDRAYLMNIV